MAETPITATYVSTTSFSVAADKTWIIPGVRVKADCGVDGSKYGTVSTLLPVCRVGYKARDFWLWWVLDWLRRKFF